MPRYIYEAVNTEGKSIEGIGEEVSGLALAYKLQERGLVVVSIAEEEKVSEKKKGGLIPRFLQYIKTHGGGRVKTDLLLLFSGQLASMIGAGLHLVRSLASLAIEMEDKRFKAIIEKVKEDVKGGASFSEALAKHPKVFSYLYVNLVNAGEMGGELDVVLNQLTIYLEKSYNLRRKVKGAITYPLVILSFAILAVLFMIWKIVPIFQNLYQRTGAELPLPTRLLIAVSSGLQEHLLLAFLALAGLCLLGRIFIHTDKGRLLFDRSKLKIPVFGPLIRKAILARFTRTLGILVGSGVKILIALELVGKVSGNKVVEKATYESMNLVESGKSISEALRQSGVFPEMIVQMTATGEEAGTLSMMLGKVADYYEQQVEATVANLSSLIEPVLIIFLGGIVGSMIVAMFLPIFKLGQAMSPGVH